MFKPANEVLVELLHQGGWMMWPLLAVSVLAATIILERAFLYASLGFSSTTFERGIDRAFVDHSLDALVRAMPTSPLFAPFTEALRAEGTLEDREQLLQMRGNSLLETLGARLDCLGVLVRVAPLMGLLGTVLGMITTFSRLAETRAGVDMTVLSGGIWQALLTTAAGLVIAIPALLAHQGFVAKKRRVARCLEQAGRVALALHQQYSSMSGGHEHA